MDVLHREIKAFAAALQERLRQILDLLVSVGKSTFERVCILGDHLDFPVVGPEEGQQIISTY